MKHRLVRLLVLLICYSLCVTGNAAISVMDTTGHRVTVTKPAKRIITLAPNLTEMVYAAGAGHDLIAVDSASNYPPQVKHLAKVASYRKLNIERIVALKPDLVLAWQGGNPRSALNILAKFHIPIYYSDPKTILDVINTIKKIGKLAGTGDVADKTAQRLLQHYQALKQQYQHKKPVTVFFQVWGKPLTTINQDSIISQVIQLCGGKNIFAKQAEIAPQVSLEAVLKADPDVIIGAEPACQHWQQQWQKWSSVTAVKRGNIFNINPSLIERPGPRMLQGARQLCHDLQVARTRYDK